MKRYRFDKSSFSFKEKKITFFEVLLKGIGYFAASIVIAIIFYFLVSIVASTDTEKRLRRENRLYSKIYPGMEERVDLIGDVIKSLKARDNAIYRDIFQADAPSMSIVEDINRIFESDSISSRHLVDYVDKRADGLFEKANVIEENFKYVMEKCGDRNHLPPLSTPLESVSYAQIGATVGMKTNPFYKVDMRHDGLDIIAPQGNVVVAVDKGIVSNITLSRKGHGNVVEVTHPSGYVTRYCHLSDIRVRRNQLVRCGTPIGLVGISGNSFAPHLHYEILREGLPVDPVNYFFASVTPSEYVNMLYMSVQTGQSMD